MGEADRLTPEGLADLARELGPAKLAEVADFIGYLKAKQDKELNVESSAWLDAVEPLEPYDWGGVDPMSLGEPVTYVEGVGAVVSEV